MKVTQNTSSVKDKRFIQGLHKRTREHCEAQVKGYAGNFYNEIADQLACEASKQLKDLEG